MIDTALERGLLPDFVIRLGIRHLNKVRLKQENQGDAERNQEKLMAYIDKLKNSPVAIKVDKANEQHYELPPEFFEIVLGKHLKYSSGYWDETTKTLDDAEKRMLDITIDRAALKDGQDILELGCGWGSLTVEMAERFRKSKITAVSNSSLQREYIKKRLKAKGLTNVKIITRDMNNFKINAKFDRIVSVEMFEHMKNYEVLFKRINGFLKKNGKLFVHIFTHRLFAYDFANQDSTDWMGRYFFSGGTMPSNHLFFHMCAPLTIEKHWLVSGTHYYKTSEAWLDKMDANLPKIIPIFQKEYGQDYQKWIQYWRVFFMAVAELFKTKNGNEWMVNHYLFSKQGG